MDNHKIQQCVDSLCQNGCQAVRAAIKAMELNLPVDCTNTLNREERYQVLAELKSIMAVYDERDCSEV